MKKQWKIEKWHQKQTKKERDRKREKKIKGVESNGGNELKIKD